MQARSNKGQVVGGRRDSKELILVPPSGGVRTLTSPRTLLASRAVIAPLTKTRAVIGPLTKTPGRTIKVQDCVGASAGSLGAGASTWDQNQTVTEK